MDTSMKPEAEGADVGHLTQTEAENQTLEACKEEKLCISENAGEEVLEECMQIDSSEEDSKIKRNEEWIRHVEEVMRADRVNADLAAAAAAVNMDRKTHVTANEADGQMSRSTEACPGCDGSNLSKRVLPAREGAAACDSESSDWSDSDDDKAQVGEQPNHHESGDEESSHPPDALLRTKNEVEAPVPPNPIASVDGPIERLGSISAVVDASVVIQALVGVPALDEGAVICFEDKSPLGLVAEIFGPIYEPFYVIKFNSPELIDKDRFVVGNLVFYAVESSKTVDRSVCHVKGSDASNMFDEEPGEDEIEYSDDEEEAEAKKKLKGRKNKSRAHASHDSASLPPAGRGIKHKEPRSSAPGQPLGSAKGHATPAILTGGMLWPNPALLAASPYPEFAGPPGWQPLRHPLPQLPLLYPLPQFPHPQGQPSPYFPGQGGRGGWQQKPS